MGFQATTGAACQLRLAVYPRLSRSLPVFSVDLPEKSAGFQTHLAKLFVFQGKSFQFILLSVYYMNMYGRILKDDDHCRQSSTIVAWQMDFQSSNAYV